MKIWLYWTSVDSGFTYLISNLRYQICMYSLVESKSDIMTLVLSDPISEG